MSSEVSSEVMAIEKTERKLTEDGNHSTTGIAPPLLPVRHQLQRRWVLWFLKADRNRDWEDCLQQVIAFDSVEDFWSLFNNIAAPSSLNWGSDYYLFKEGIRPMWEDKQNVDGGRWLMVVDKHKRKQFLDDYWLELLMAIVGEQFGDYGDHICGAVLNVRNKGDKISLWTHDASQDSVNSQIGKIFKAKMNVPDEEIIKYEVHKDASKRASSIVKPRITIQGESIVFKHNNDQHKPQPTAATVETKG